MTYLNNKMFNIFVVGYFDKSLMMTLKARHSCCISGRPNDVIGLCDLYSAQKRCLQSLTNGFSRPNGIGLCDLYSAQNCCLQSLTNGFRIIMVSRPYTQSLVWFIL